MCPSECELECPSECELECPSECKWECLLECDLECMCQLEWPLEWPLEWLLECLFGVFVWSGIRMLSCKFKSQLCGSFIGISILKMI